MKAILEKIHQKQNRSITAFLYCDDNFVTPWHFHPQFELTYIEKSVGTKFIGDFVGLYHPGELVLLGSNLPHCWKNNIDKETNSTSYVVHWNRDIYPMLPELRLVHEMLKSAAKGLIFDAETAVVISKQLKRLSSLKADLLYAEFLLILIQLSKSNFTLLSERKFDSNISKERSSRIVKIQDFVDANYQSKIYLKSLANEVNMTEQSVSRFFSQTMGRPFFTYLNEYRINCACRILIDTSMSIAEVAFACGFESLPFFHKQFNKFKSETPARFRKKYL